MFGTFLDFLEHDAQFDGKHRGEQAEEDEEGEGYATCADLRDGGADGQHVLNGPWLTTELGNQPAALAGDIGQRNQCDSRNVQPLGLADILLINEEEYHGKKEDEQTAQSHHDAESPEVNRDEGHQLGLVLDIAIAEILEVLVDDLRLDGGSLLVALGFCLPVISQGLDGFLSAFDLLVGRWLHGAVGLGIAVQQFVDTRHIAMDIVRSHERERIRHRQFESRLGVVLVVGLRKRINPRHSRQADVVTTII